MPEADAVSQEEENAPKTASLAYKVSTVLLSSTDYVENVMDVIVTGARTTLATGTAALLAAYTLY